EGCQSPPKHCWKSAKFVIAIARLTGPFSVRPTNAATPVGARAMPLAGLPSAAPARPRRCARERSAALFAIGVLFARAQLALSAGALEVGIFSGDLREHEL